MKSKDQFIIYALIDPRTDEVRYIGKSTIGLRRPNQHMKAYSLIGNTHKNNWIKSLQLISLNPVIDILEVHTNKVDLNEAECFYISYLKSIGCNLTNVTNGGEGTEGYTHKEATVETIRRKALERGPTGVCVNKKIHIIEAGIEKRECRLCETFKDITDFGFNKHRNKFYGQCRDCDKLRKRAARAIKPDSTRYVKLSPEAYKASRIEAARKGGLALANSPEKRAAISAKRSKPIVAISENNNTQLEFPSALKAKEQGFHNKLIGDAIKSGRPYKGYFWKFKA